MCLRWTAAETLKAEQQLRKIIGYRDLARLALAMSATSQPTTPTFTPEQGGRLIAATA